MSADIVIPDWRRAFTEQLKTARKLPHEIEEIIYGGTDTGQDPDKGTLWLPVAGRRLDQKHDYSRIFPRDMFTSEFIFEDSGLLRDILLFSAMNQGRRRNPVTAEEHGKIPHEVEGVPIKRGKVLSNTLFCACDTTLLFLIGAARYAERADFADREAMRIWRYLVPRIIHAWGYVQEHLNDDDGLFWEDPAYANARAFALRATYLRDGGLCGRRGRRLAYPVSFLLVQAQAIAGIRALITLSRHGVFPEERRSIEEKLRRASEAFRKTFSGNEDGFVVAIDRQGPIALYNTDVGLALWYLEPEDLDEAYKTQCLATLAALKTPWGWRSTSHPRTPPRPGDHKDHATVWPADQAFIAMGLEKHNLLAEKHRGVALSTARALLEGGVPFSELLRIQRNRAHPAGCHIQLWTAAYWAWAERQLQIRASE